MIPRDVSAYKPHSPVGQRAPSRTALRVAMRRAVHQTADYPLVFEDPLAHRLVAAEVDRLGLRLKAPKRDSSRTLRAFLAARSRYAEDILSLGVQRGVTQYVLLGAGLDTFAYRNPYRSVRCFEIDHPATQQWKLSLLASSGIAVPPSVVHLPVDFEHQSLTAELIGSVYDPLQRTLFAWLGVVPYLTRKSFLQTLDVIAAQPAGSGVILDYGVPRSARTSDEQVEFDSLAERVAAAGEPFLLFFNPGEIAELLRQRNFNRLEDMAVPEINERYFSGRADGLSILGTSAHLLSAWIDLP